MSRHLAPAAIVFLLAVGVTMPASPYGINTHRAISDGAVIQSSLNDYLIEVLSLEEGIATPFNDRDVRDWIRLGGALEDNLPRPANHFHYPLRPWDRAKLTDFPGSRSAKESSVLWAQDPDQGDLEDTWSWTRARLEFFDALVLTDATEREVAFGNSFRALGQVLHLVADGSVPAHARNDSHLVGEPIETWLDGQARRRSPETEEQARQRFLSAFAPNSVGFSRTIFGTTPNPLATIPIAKVFDADTYDGTATTLGVTTGDTVGITEFSNANFFSADTVFADTFIGLERFSPFPSHTAVEQYIDPVNNRRYWRKAGPGVPVDHLATVSRLDFFRPERPPLTGGLDPVVHDEYAQLLVPRAVGYSIGLIDYFFRGRLAAVDAEFTETGVTLKVTNAIDPEQSPPWANEKLFSHDNQLKPGRFVLTVTYKQGEVEQFAASDPITLEKAEALDPGQTSTQILSFDLPPLPAEATDVEYRLVFRGRLGKEDDAIAVGIVEPVSGFIVRPNYVPADDIAGNRLIVKSGGKWRLTEDRGLQAGNIDWKGWYENGKPTKILSWFGPKARHFPDPSGDPFFSGIYQNGELFSRSIVDVLGAAIARDSEGKEWLIVIAKTGNSDLVLRRPNKKSDSSAFFDPVTNPEGWQVIGNFPWAPDFKPPNRPWFFNGEGTEAQTMREVIGVEPNKLDRLQLRITPDLASADLARLGNLAGITDTIAIDTKETGRDSVGICDRIPLSRDSDHKHFTVSVTHTFSGEYIVAVDYKNMTEVFGRITGTGDSVWTATTDYDWDCQKNTIFLRIADSYVETYEQTANESLAFDVGDAGKSITVNSLVLSATATRSQLTVDHGFREGEAMATISYSRLIELIYLDLRDDLYVTIEQAAPSNSIMGSIVDESICVDSISKGATVWAISHKTLIPVSEQPFEQISLCRDYGLPGTGPMFSNYPFGTKIIFPTVRTGARTGSWAIDSNGELLVSQEFLDSNGEVKYFNFLTSGELGSIIPGAPDNGRYFPAAVVK